MKSMIGFLGIILLTGCATYQPIALQDHSDRPLTTVQVVKRRNYLVWRDTRHQFYLCKETGNALQCELECDGKTPFECPRGNSALTVGSTNVR